MSTKPIGVKEIAEFMGYTEREAWEYIRKIGVPSMNPDSMKLARFTWEEFDAARERAKRPLEARKETGAVAKAARELVPQAAPITSAWGEKLRKG